MKARDRAYMIARTSGSVEDFARFRLLRAETSNTLDSAKYHDIVTRLSDAPNAEAKWRELRNLRITAPTRPSPFLTFDAATLNTHFASVLNRHPSVSEHGFESAAIRPLSPHISDYFDLRLVSEHDVADALMSSSSKASGWDGLSMPMLKLVASAILGSLTKLCIPSLAHATFPQSWKKALIRPLAKSETMTQPYHTRPIAKLLDCSKILEKLAHNQLQGFLKVNGILHPRQAGFRRGHSTQTALLGISDDIRYAIDKRMLTLLIFYDFSKAFDSIPHALLLAKLRAINVSNRAL